VSSSGYVIEGNTIACNDGTVCGGILLDIIQVRISNNLICGNRSMNYAGGIGQIPMGKGGQLAGNTIVGNRGPQVVSSRLNWRLGLLVSDNVFWNNSSGRVSLGSFYGPVVVEYCNIQGGRDMVGKTATWGTGNIDADPLFVDPGHWDDGGTPTDLSDDTFIPGDYRLLPGSPCIDAGTNDVDNPDTPEIETLPAADIAGLPRVIDGNLDGTATVDIGAYEYLPGDVNYDGTVNVLDLLLVRNSMGSDPASSIQARKADVNADGGVNVLDLLVVRGRLGK